MGYTSGEVEAEKFLCIEALTFLLFHPTKPSIHYTNYRVQQEQILHF